LKIEGRKYDVKIGAVAAIAASRLTEDVMPPEILEKSKPEFVSPLVLYLCADRCPVSGNIYNAGMGFFNRAAVVTGSGAVIGSHEELPTVDQIAAGIGKIGDLKNGKEYWQLNEQIGDVMAAFAAPADGGVDAGAPEMSVADVFEGMKQAFVPDAAAGVDVVFQYNIDGEGGGDWYCAVKDGACEIAAGVHDAPVCTLKMGAADFLAMMSGTLPAMQAYTSGKLKIEGDIMKSQLLEKLFKM